MSFIVGLIVGALMGLFLFLYVRKRKNGSGVLQPSISAGLEGLNAFPEPLALTENGTIVFHNAAFDRELGTLAGKRSWTGWLACVEPSESIEPEDAPTVHVAKGSPRSDVRFKTVDGRILHWTAVPFPGLGRKLTLNIVRDVSAWTGPEYDQSIFMNRAAHELKTPITSIKGYSELIQLYSQMGKEITPEIAGRIVDQTNRLVHLVNQLLDVARLGTGRLTDNPEPIELSIKVPQIIDHIRQQFPHRRIELNMKDASETLIDPMRLEQVIREFALNALQYSPAEEPVIITLSSDHDLLLLEIEDRGIGIPAQDRERIYDRFTRGSNVTSMPGAGGYGLGLYIASEILKRWHGTIDIGNSPNGPGTRVKVSWPRRPPPHLHERAAEEAEYKDVVKSLQKQQRENSH